MFGEDMDKDLRITFFAPTVIYTFSNNSITIVFGAVRVR